MIGQTGQAVTTADGHEAHLDDDVQPLQDLLVLVHSGERGQRDHATSAAHLSHAPDLRACKEGLVCPWRGLPVR